MNKEQKKVGLRCDDCDCKYQGISKLLQLCPRCFKKHQIDSIKKMIEGKREKLADLEHEQWSHWTKYFLDTLKKPNWEEELLRWKKQTETPYKDLSEKEKDSDRKWADIIIKDILKEL